MIQNRENRTGLLKVKISADLTPARSSSHFAVLSRTSQSPRPRSLFAVLSQSGHDAARTLSSSACQGRIESLRRLSRSYATAPVKKEEKVKVPLALFGGTGNYASALYLAAVKANALDKVESELFDLIGAAQKSVKFTHFAKDPTVPSATRVKAIKDICAQAKFSDVTTNFLVVLADNGRLRFMDSIADKFAELTMAHRGEVKATVTTVIPIPPEEEKELKETLQDIIGQGKKVKLEQKIDPSILGGLVVEFELKVFDMSIRTRARQMERFLRDPINIGNL